MESWGRIWQEAICITADKPYLSFRLSPRTDPGEMGEKFFEEGVKSWKSPYFTMFSEAIPSGIPFDARLQ